MRDYRSQPRKFFRFLLLLVCCVCLYSRAAVIKSDSVVVQQNGNTVAFETGADHNAYFNWESVTTGQWSGWASLGSAGGGFITPPNRLVQQSGNTVVFELAADHNIYCNWESVTTGQWSGWASLGSAGGGFAATPSVIMQQSGNTVVFEVGSDHNIYFNWESAATGQWSGWGSLGSTGGGFTTPPVVIVQQSGNTVVFEMGADHNVYLNWESATTGQWSGWASLGSAGNGFITKPAAIVQQNGNTAVFEVGADQNVYFNWQSSTTEEWSGWGSLGMAGGGFTQPPAVVVQQNGNTVVTEVGADQNVYIDWQSSATEQWSGWGSLGMAGSGFAETPSLIVQHNGNTVIAELGADRNAYIDWQSSTNEAWSGWGSLGSAGGGFLADAYVISGQTLAGGSGVSGVAVSLSGTTATGTTVSLSTTTDANGHYSFSVLAGGNYVVTPSLAGYTFSPASQTFSNVGANQTANFSVASTPGDANPDPSPAAYPNDLSSPPAAPSGNCNRTGNWADAASGGTWSLTQIGSTLSGTLSGTPPAQYGCSQITWQVSGTLSGSAANLSASNPSPAVQSCSSGSQWTASNPLTATVTFSSCSAGSANEIATYPAGSQFASGGSGSTTLSGSGPWNLVSNPLTFSVSSPSQVPIPGASNAAQMIPMSTGDTNAQIKTTSSVGSYPVNVTYSAPLEGNPHSSCAASLSIPNGAGTGSATSTISASPTGCSGIFGVYGNVGGTTTQNAIDVVLPPQVLIQVLYGEAHGQAVTGDSVSEPAIGATIRNRLGDTVYFPGINTYQDAITPSQFMGINTSITTGTTPELNNAALIYGGVTTTAMDVANCKCFFTPDAAGWSQIQAALNSGTTILPAVNSDPKCFQSNRQFVYKSSIGNNANGNGAPAFIFEQWRKSADPAAIRIP